MRDLIKDNLPLIEAAKKPWGKMDSNSEPIYYETVALTTLSPHLPLTHGTSLDILFSTQDKFTGTPTIQSLTGIDNFYLDSFFKIPYMGYDPSKMARQIFFLL